MNLHEYIAHQINMTQEAIDIKTGNKQFDNGYELAAGFHLKSLRAIDEMLEKEQEQIWRAQALDYVNENIPF